MKQLFASAPLKRIIGAVDDMSELKSKPPYQMLYELAFSLVEIHQSFKEKLGAQDIPFDIGL